MLTLKDKVAVITGAASGIGREISLELAREGCHIAVSDINEDGLRETAEDAKKYGIKASTHLIDVSSKDQMSLFPEEVMQHHEHIHVIVNNAGCTVFDNFRQGSLDDFEWLMDINFWGVVYGCKFFLPYLLNEQEGHIVNISSVFGLMGVPYQPHYCASKYAVRGFSESLKEELKETPVNVSCVFPGGVKTDIIKNCRFKNVQSEFGKDDLENLFQDKIAGTTAKKAAGIIVGGIKKQKHRIIIGKDAWTVDLIQRLFPGRAHAIISKLQNAFKKGA